MLLLAVGVGAGEVLPLVAVAALCHEIGHLAALYLSGAAIEEIALTWLGAEIRADTRYLPYWKDILCTLAGPLVNIFLAFVFGRVSEDYLLAGANLLQGLFNLLPLPGLDGSRVMHLLISWCFDPNAADRICHAVELCAAGIMCIAAFVFLLYERAGLFLLLASGSVFRNVLKDKCGK